MSDRKIIQFMLVTERDDKGEEFQIQINRYIRNGWQPFGNLLCADFEGDQFYDLCMVKYDS